MKFGIGHPVKVNVSGVWIRGIYQGFDGYWHTLYINNRPEQFDSRYYDIQDDVTPKQIMKAIVDCKID